MGGKNNLKNIIGVRFKKPGKIYFFDPGKNTVTKEDHVIVETSMGEEYAEVVITNRTMPEDKVTSPLKKIIRVATKEDDKHNKENKKREKEAFEIALKNIKADGRIDFRELVKDLAAIFRTRIELRQIGVRDEVKRLGGNGICGRELCCCSFLSNFETVSIKMAKEQNIALTPSKISGSCGRLMCCLKYEQEVYEEKLSRLPKVGAIVKTEEGEGIVDSIEILKEKIRVKFKDKEGYFYKKYDANDVEIIKNVEEEDKIEDKELEELERLEKEDEKNKYED